MLRKVVGAVTGLCGSAVDVLDSVIFANIAQNQLLSPLFKPMGGLILGATLAGPCLEKKADKQFFKVLGYIPAATANVAIWALEGPAVVYVFTAAMASSGVVMLAEVAYKAHQGEEINKMDLLVRSGKHAGILATLLLGGTGKVIELIRAGSSITLPQKVAAYGAAGFAALGALRNTYSHMAMFAKSCCSAESKAAPSYVELSTDLEKAEMEESGTKLTA